MRVESQIIATKSISKKKKFPKFIKGTVFILYLNNTSFCSVVSNALRQVSCILKVLREKTNEDYGFFINKTLLEKHNILYIH